jgi:hypothetical protein
MAVRQHRRHQIRALPQSDKIEAAGLFAVPFVGAAQRTKRDQSARGARFLLFKAGSTD